MTTLQQLLLLVIIIQIGNVTSTVGINDYFLNQAREAPFCVDETIEDVKNFKPIFKYFETHPHEVILVAKTPEIVEYKAAFITTSDHGTTPLHKPAYVHTYKDFKVTFNRMNPLPVPPKQQLFNLRQWFHIHVHSDVPFRALYVQSISAPLGIPFGEFRSDFNCFDCQSEEKHYSVKDRDIEIVPCKFRSFHSYMHPHIVVIGGKSNVTPFFDAHFHFNWFEASCQEAPLMQFLFVAVREWENIPQGFDAFYSQVINNTIPDSIDGTAYPFHIDFDGKMACHGAPQYPTKNWTADMIREFDPLKARPHNKFHSRLMYNKDFDDCVKNGGVGGEKNQCPPGPFRCIKSDGNPLPDQDFVESVKLRIDSTNENVFQVCPTCLDTEGPRNPNKKRKKKSTRGSGPHDNSYLADFEYRAKDNDITNDETGTSEEVNQPLQPIDDDLTEIEQEFSMNENEINELAHVIHRTLMVFAWVTCPLISNYLARFYKESGHGERGAACSNVGCWLWAHIGLSYASLAAMWGGLGVVFFFDSSCKPDSDGKISVCSDSIHRIFGIIAIVLFHIQHLSGWCRPIGASIRTVYIWCHVVFGYGAQIFGVASFFVMMNEIPKEMTTAVIAALGVGLLFYGVSTLLQVYSDWELLLEAPRGWCPVPEAIDVTPNAPCSSVRAVILILYIFGQLCLSIWVMVAQRRD